MFYLYIKSAIAEGIKRGLKGMSMAAIGRTVTALWCGLVAMPAFAAETPTGTCPPPGTIEARWVGNGLMRGGKGYVSTPMGQVHYRLVRASEGPVLVLLHQTPWSMNQYAEVQACLAAHGVSSLAIDTPGYGLSDPPPDPTICCPCSTPSAWSG
jgi:hypothetical protein